MMGYNLFPAVNRCGQDKFECNDGKCVRDPRDVCDTIADCDDRSDENTTMCASRVRRELAQ